VERGHRQASYAKVKKLINQLQTDINEAVAGLKGTYESWQEQQDTLRRTALTKIEAREHVAKEAAESRLPRPSSPEGCQRRPCLNPARPSQDSAAGEGSGPVIGKSGAGRGRAQGCQRRQEGRVVRKC
jgi:hypothetical protein